MSTVDYLGVEIDACDDHGVWLDQSELLSVTEVERHNAASFQLADLWRTQLRPPVDEDRVLSCPKCAKPMRLQYYEAVHMDWCPGHGIWLDKGELAAILNNLRLNPLYTSKAALRIWDNKY